MISPHFPSQLKLSIKVEILSQGSVKTINNQDRDSTGLNEIERWKILWNISLSSHLGKHSSQGLSMRHILLSWLILKNHHGGGFCVFFGGAQYGLMLFCKKNVF